MSDQRGESNFNLGTSFDEELERQSRTTTTSRVEPASSDPLSFLLSGAEEESKKPRRIREFESIFDVSKLIEEKTHSSGTASSASAPSSLPSATAAGSAAATTTSSRGGGSSRPSLFLTGGNEEDFLKVIEQATKKAHANKRQHEHDDNEEEEEKAVDSLRPTPLEMCSLLLPPLLLHCWLTTTTTTTTTNMNMTENNLKAEGVRSALGSHALCWIDRGLRRRCDQHQH